MNLFLYLLPLNNMLECLGFLFKYEAWFLNTAKDSICTCFHHLFNNCLDFTISSLLIYGPKSKILYTDLVFYLYCQLWEICSWGILALFTPVYCESLSGCTFVLEWMLHNGSWVWLLCLSQVKTTLFFSKTTLGTNLYCFISHCERKWSVV